MATSSRTVDGTQRTVYNQTFAILSHRRDFFITQQNPNTSIFAVGRKVTNMLIIVSLGIFAVVLLFLFTLLALVIMILMAGLYASSQNNSIHVFISEAGENRCKVTFTVIGKESVNLARYMAQKLGSSDEANQPAAPKKSISDNGAVETDKEEDSDEN